MKITVKENSEQFSKSKPVIYTVEDSSEQVGQYSPLNDSESTDEDRATMLSTRQIKNIVNNY